MNNNETDEKNEPAVMLSETEQVDGQTELGFGQVLQNERIRRGLNISEVARRLRLSEHLIKAIEAQDFSKLPRGVFLRGYIRNYAGLLQLDNVDKLLGALPVSDSTRSDYTDQNLAQRFKTMEPVVQHKRNSRGGWLYVLVIVVALVAYGFYFENHPGQDSYFSDSSEKQDTIISFGSVGNSDEAVIDLALPSQPQLQSAPAPELPAVPSSPVIANEQLAPLSESSIPTQSEFDDSTAEVISDGMKRLHFVFSRDSWVKIKDSDGKVILEKTHLRGTEQSVDGKPPLYLVIGNAAGVALTYNGNKVDLAPYTRGSDDVARFSLE